MSATTASARSIDDIESDLAAARARLAENIGSLIAEVHPKAVVHRSFEDVKTLARQNAAALADQARERAAWVQGQFRDERGWRIERLAAAIGGLVALLTFIGVVRRSRR
jgi:hypothetical protein